MTVCFLVCRWPFACCIFTWQRIEKEKQGLWHLFYKDTNPIIMTLPSQPDHLPKSPLLNTIILRVRASALKVGRGDTRMQFRADVLSICVLWLHNKLPHVDGLQQHTCIISFLCSGICTQLSWVLCQDLKACNSGAGQGCYLIWGVRSSFKFVGDCRIISLQLQDWVPQLAEATRPSWPLNLCTTC